MGLGLGLDYRYGRVEFEVRGLGLESGDLLPHDTRVTDPFKEDG